MVLHTAATSIREVRAVPRDLGARFNNTRAIPRDHLKRAIAIKPLEMASCCARLILVSRMDSSGPFPRTRPVSHSG
jgi:hypothetical protein